MTKIRTSLDLVDVLDQEMAWRKKEVFELIKAVNESQAGTRVTYIRSGVALLYAHWEGFIKRAANAYVEYVGTRLSSMADVMPSFAAMSMKKKLMDAHQASAAGPIIAAIDHVLSSYSKPIVLPSDPLKTHSNLSSDVLRNIFTWLALDISRYEARFTLIDETLLQSRNGIAHGEYLEMDVNRFRSLVDEMLELMAWFKTDIENAVALKSYLRAART